MGLGQFRSLLIGFGRFWSVLDRCRKSLRMVWDSFGKVGSVLARFESDFEPVEPIWVGFVQAKRVIKRGRTMNLTLS